MINEKHSYQDYMNKKFLDTDPSEFSNTHIIGTCFYQENPTDKPILVDVFPEGTENVTFERCILDNVKLPPNSTIIGKTPKQVCAIETDEVDEITGAKKIIDFHVDSKGKKLGRLDDINYVRTL